MRKLVISRHKIYFVTHFDTQTSNVRQKHNTDALAYLHSPQKYQKEKLQIKKNAKKVKNRSYPGSNRGFGKIVYYDTNKVFNPI